MNTSKLIAPFSQVAQARHEAAQVRLGADLAADNPVAFDADLMRRLLTLALSRGGDYADLYFEYRAGADYVYEDEKVKTVGRGISLGLGVRVLRGEATGYAYTEELSEAAMAEAARTAAQIAAHGQSPAPVAIEPRPLPSFYPVSLPTIVTLPEAKLALLRRADKAARAYDPRITKVQCSFAEELKEILLCTADGRLYRDTQPLMRFGVHVVAEQDGKRQSGSGGGGGGLISSMTLVSIGCLMTSTIFLPSPVTSA